MRPRAKVTIYLLWPTDVLYFVYEKSIGTKMNDFDLCLEVVVMSTIALHSTLNISETVNYIEIDAWFQKTTNRKWPIMGYHHHRDR